LLDSSNRRTVLPTWLLILLLQLLVENSPSQTCRVNDQSLSHMLMHILHMQQQMSDAN